MSNVGLNVATNDQENYDQQLKIFGYQLQRFRRMAGYTQAQLSEMVGVDQGYISRLERGTRSPALVTVFRLATILRIQPAAFLESN